MKNISILILFIVFASCKQETKSVDDLTPRGIEAKTMPTAEELQNDSSPTKPTDGKYPVMTFDEIEYNFGEIKQGDVVSHVFSFKNTGESDLIITNAQASCGCTVPEYPKDAVKPGESGKIKVTFDSKGKNGITEKSITITCNTESRAEVIKIKSTIIVPN